MSNFEDRLRSQLHDAASSVQTTAPPIEPLLVAASSRRRQAVAARASGVALLSIVVLTSVMVARAVEGGDDTVTRHEAELTTDFSTTTSTRREAPATTTPRRVQTPATTVDVPAPAPTVTTTTPTAVAASDARPLAQRVPTGLWAVGLDGTNLRRIGDAGRYAWSPDGTMVAVATDRIWVLSTTDGRSVGTIESGAPAGSSVGCLDWSSKGTIGWVSSDGTIRFARSTDRVATVVAKGSPSLHGYLEDGCRWSPDGSVFATAGDGFGLYAPDGQRLPTPTDARVAFTSGIQWSPDGRTLAVLAADRDNRQTGVALLSGEGWTQVAHATTGTELYRLAWAADGRKLLLRELSRMSVLDVATQAISIETTTCCFSVLTPLIGGDYLTVGSGEAVRFLSSAWEPRGTMLTAEAYPAGCDGSFFASMRLSPNQRELVVEAQVKGGAAAKCDKRRPF